MCTGLFACALPVQVGFHAPAQLSLPSSPVCSRLCGSQGAFRPCHPHCRQTMWWQVCRPSSAVLRCLSLWKQVGSRLAACDLPLMQAFAAFQLSSGHPWRELPPTPIGAQERALIYAGVTGQRYSSESAKGLDHLLPPGLGKHGHVQASAALPSPFAPCAWPDADVAFMAHTIGTWRELLPILAQRQRRVFQTIVRAVQPLQTRLAQLRCCSAQRVAASKDAAAISCFTTLLRWPDVWQAQEMILGFPIVGEIPSSGLFRLVPAQADKLKLTAGFRRMPLQLSSASWKAVHQGTLLRFSR